MALGRQRPRQTDMVVTWAELPRSPGHIFYDRLQSVLIEVYRARFFGHKVAVKRRPS
jgi:hypothetical protein